MPRSGQRCAWSPIRSTSSKLILGGRQRRPRRQLRPGRDIASRTLRVDADKIDTLAGIAEELIVAKQRTRPSVGPGAPAASRADALVQGLLASQTGLDRMGRCAAPCRDASAPGAAVPRCSGIFPGWCARSVQRWARISTSPLARRGDRGRQIFGRRAVRTDPSPHPQCRRSRHRVRGGAARGGQAGGAGRSRSARAASSTPSSSKLPMTAKASIRRRCGARPRIAASCPMRLWQPCPTARRSICLFMPGFSTVSTVTDLSGRGVGLDAVGNAVARLGGRIALSSRPGIGTSFRLSLPASVVLTGTIIVACARRVLRHSDGDGARNPSSIVGARRAIRNGRAFTLRDMVVADLRSGGVARAAVDAAAGRSQAARVPAWRRRGGQSRVDEFGDRHSLLLRPMGGLLSGMPGIAGTALLGTGQVLIILDLPELVA